MGGDKYINNFSRKTKMGGPHWILRHRRQISITINPRDIGHCSGQGLLRVFVNMAMNLWDSVNLGKFLTSLAVVPLS